MAENAATTHTRRAEGQLREQILCGQLAAGMRLHEVALAEALQISRTPVRAAMSRLAEEGLLDRARGGGFVVRSFGLGDVVDALELRGVLEGTAARLAAERGPVPETMQAMEAIAAELDGCFGAGPDAVDFECYSELNADFHAKLAALPGSAILRRELERATRLPFASASAFLDASADSPAFRRSLSHAQEQHRTLLSAISKREGCRAEAIAREHARLARRNLDAAMRGDRSRLAQMPGLGLIVG